MPDFQRVFRIFPKVFWNFQVRTRVFLVFPKFHLFIWFCRNLSFFSKIFLDFPENKNIPEFPKIFPDFLTNFSEFLSLNKCFPIFFEIFHVFQKCFWIKNLPEFPKFFGISSNNFKFKLVFLVFPKFSLFSENLPEFSKNWGFSKEFPS